MFGLNRKELIDEPPAFDRDYLARLEGHVGREVLRELVADGLFELTDRIERVSECADRGDVHTIGSLAHDIAGVAGHLGLTHLSRMAVEMNRTARRDPGIDAAALVGPMRAAGPMALASLRTFLDETLGKPQNHN